MRREGPLEQFTEVKEVRERSTVRLDSLRGENSSRNSLRDWHRSRGCGTDFPGPLDSPQFHALEECHFRAVHSMKLNKFIKNSTEIFLVLLSISFLLPSGVINRGAVLDD